jgi:hypothetical protein
MIKKILKNFYLKTNKKHYDENHLGTFSFWRLFFYNIFLPGRTINRIKFNQIKKNSSKIIESFSKMKFKENNNCSKKELTNALDNLIKQGGCVIPNYFSSKKIDEFLDDNNELIKKMRDYKSDQISYKIEIVKLSKKLVELWLDENLINLIKSFLSTNIFARNYPYLYYTYVPSTLNKDKILNSKAASSWHVDHSVLFNLHILLDDIKEDETCMEILPRSHKSLNIASLYSESVINKFSQERIKCFGSKGTVYMHTGNVVHRLKPVAGKNRLNLHFEFSPGSNILLDIDNISKTLNSNFDLNNLNDEKRDILKGIFPKKELKGYDIKKDKIYPTKFLGI